MQVLKTPGVYVQEIATLPPSVAEVSTAIPAFIGRTQRGTAPARISSFLEYQDKFGTVPSSSYTVRVDSAAGLTLTRTVDPAASTLYYHLSHYFTNGGGPCWIFPAVGGATIKAAFLAALASVEAQDEPTLILFPEAAGLFDIADFGELAQMALAQCNKLKDRFTVLDVPGGDAAAFRDAVGINNLSYGAAYHPYLATTIVWRTDDDSVQVQKVDGANMTVFTRSVPDAAGGIIVSWTGDSTQKPKVRVDAADPAQPASFALDGLTLRITNAGTKTGAEIVTAWTAFKAANQAGGFDIVADGTGATPIGATAPQGLQLNSQAAASVSLASLKTSETALYNQIKDALSKQRVTLPPSAAMVGVFAAVDRDRGVWKAPANVSVSGVIGATIKLTDDAQEDLNVDPTAGKSINAIRDFTGRGTIVWGSRTLAGNDNEWRYVPVRRLFINIEESTKKASAFAVFEPNDATTWLKVKGMIESYLYTLWERGALAGSKPDQAYYVNVGLGRR